jgi:hypothetical protein
MRLQTILVVGIIIVCVEINDSFFAVEVEVTVTMVVAAVAGHFTEE